MLNARVKWTGHYDHWADCGFYGSSGLAIYWVHVNVGWPILPFFMGKRSSYWHIRLCGNFWTNYVILSAYTTR